MKVVHLWKGYGLAGGGGGVWMLRLHLALRDAGIDSSILCEFPEGDVPGVQEAPRWRIPEAALRVVTQRLGLNDVHRISSHRLGRHPAVRDADLLHLHGTHSSFMSYLALPGLTRRRPAVFTLHDTWAMAGHCTYSYDCERWRTGCGSCPYPQTYPPVKRDATAVEWKLKRRAFSRSDVRFVAPSRWMESVARESLIADHEIRYIPYGLDTEIYRPVDRGQAREALGLPDDAFVVMFGAMDASDRRKGGDLLAAALRALPEHVRAKVILLVLGVNGRAMEDPTGLPVAPLGFVGSDSRKAIAYSAADLFVLPTRADNLPIVLLESMACATPVVSYDVGGVADEVRPGETGYLARPEDAYDLAFGMRTLLENPAERERIGRTAREVVLTEFGLERSIHRHVELYESALAE